MTVDYKATIFLPRTDFPMRAGLPKQEPTHLARWEKMGLYRLLREQAQGKEKFILHEGPPYANGHLHIGHALNKILKDVVIRSRQMLGFDAPYVPGWDCHGLPIEWKIEERYREKGIDKDAVPLVEFLKECRDFAAKWVDVQREEFRRLGCLGDWDNPYLTMARSAEARIVRELGKFVMNGGLYRGAKPVLWSVVEKTALAEAEVEYQDHVSETIWIRFPVIASSHPALEGASVVIWTTTPWTMPGNRAIAYGLQMEYAVIRVEEVKEGSLAKVGEALVVCEALLSSVCRDAGIGRCDVVARFRGDQLAGVVCRHPWRGQGYDFDVPLLSGSFVTTEAGTGFVHIAPGHGEDDYALGRDHGIAVPATVDGDGTYYDHVPLLAGEHVYKAAPKVLRLMSDAGALLAHGRLSHSYPHSWRSKAPLIYRTTPQWFISMETGDLRQKALAAIEKTRFVPASGKNRIRSMVENRPDWCVSRQRAWGVPITVFANRKTGEPLRDQKVFDRIVAAIEEEGVEAWFTWDPQNFLGNDHALADYEQVRDILDVWFDSGSTHAFVLEQREELGSPADLYLEGSDQHRGWFQSSLLESCGTRGTAPFRAILTHGFVLDEQGRKMSKSLGNVVLPQEVTDNMGADILRLWVVASDYSGDLRIGPDILKQSADMYRRLRNTLRFLLGALDGFDAETETLADMTGMPELERWVLHRVSEMDALVRRCVEEYDFHTWFAELNQFCTVDLSAFYFDIRKDALYCDHPADDRRRACRTVLHILFEALVRWMAPALCFTAEEAWLSRHPGDESSIHLTGFLEIPASWRDEALAAKWDVVRRIRRVVLGALEKERAERRIGTSLQAVPDVYAPEAMIDVVRTVAMEDVCITSALVLIAAEPPEGAYQLADVPSVGVMVGLAGGKKCQRCWKVLSDVGAHGYEGVCGRCADVVGRME